MPPPADIAASKPTAHQLSVKRKQPSTQTSISQLFASSKSNHSREASADSCGSNKRPRTSTIDPMSTASLSPGVNGAAPPPIANPEPVSKKSHEKMTATAQKGFQPQRGARRIVVKNLRTTSRFDPDAYFNDTWTRLDKALTWLFDGKPLPFTQEELYRGVENICRNGQAEKLHGKLRAKCDAHIDTVLEDRLSGGIGGSDTVLLGLVVKQWTKWEKQLQSVINIFLFLDRSYLLSSRLPSLHQQGVDMFREHIVSNTKLQDRIFSGMFSLFRAGRNKTESEPELLSSAMRMIYDLNMFSNQFEPAFLENTQDYYDELANKHRDSLDLKEWIIETARLISDENAKCRDYKMSPTSTRSINQVMDQMLISDHAAKHTSDGMFPDLVQRSEFALLGDLYGLLCRVDQTTVLKKVWSAYITTAGREIVLDEAHDAEMIQRLLCFKISLDTILTQSFSSDAEVADGLRESFKTFINESKRKGIGSRTMSASSKVAEMVSKHLDLLLRSGRKGIPAGLAQESISDDEEQLSYQLDLALDLFRFIQGKDVFEAFYKKDLARRLLLNRSASADAERSMLSKLKTECGAQFTHNLESMFKDIDLARESMDNYRSTYGSSKQDLELYVNVLSSAAWPTYADAKILIPATIDRHLEQYRKHYGSLNKGRSLVFKHALAHCVITARFPTCTKELVVSSFQAVVLLVFNDCEPGQQVTYPQIKAATQLDDLDLIRTLQSLACGKYRVLAKTPKGKDISESDTFTINAQFQSPAFRIKINQVQLKETPAENKETYDRVFVDRDLETQAAVVRIMKSQKKMGHSALVSEVINVMKNRGAMEVSQIKGVIEKLIEKDYIERGDDGEYQYSA